MIIVTGASGKLGHAIVEQLLKRTEAGKVGVSVRDPEKGRDFAAKGVRVRKGDFGDPKSLVEAFEGASQVLIISSNARAFGGDPIAQHASAIAAAQAAGAKRILYTSQISSSPSSAFGPGVDHAATEALLRSAGLPFTALRNGFYATQAVSMVKAAMKSGELVTPEDGKFSWVSHADLAEAAAAILVDEGRFEGATPPLTGSEALDSADLARIAGIRHLQVSDDEYCARLVKGGTPEKVARFVLGMFIAARRGEFATVDPTLPQLVGHTPQTLGEILGAQ